MKRASAAACSISDNVMDDFFIGFSTTGKYDRLSPSLMQFHKYCMEHAALADIGAVPSAFCWRFSASEKGFSAPGSCKSHCQFTSWRLIVAALWVSAAGKIICCDVKHSTGFLSLLPAFLSRLCWKRESLSAYRLICHLAYQTNQALKITLIKRFSSSARVGTGRTAAFERARNRRL